MKLAIGAIFRDEFDYIIEWLAWHEMAGFSTFYIADNGSTDGTRELLEALSDLGKIHLLYQPIVEKQAQIRAYNRIAQLTIDQSDAVLFIDADEFLTHDSMEEGAEYNCLKNLLEDDEVGMVGINWRCFGSSNLKTQDDRPVVERFTKCLADKYNSKNGYLKSASKLSLSKYIGPHKADFFSDYRRINPKGDDLVNFIKISPDKIESVDNSGITAKTCISPLRVNHYVIKSKQEYTEKKRKRGDGMLGIVHDRGEVYFNQHDFNDEIFNFPRIKIDKLKQKMIGIQKQLEHSLFTQEIKGSLDINNNDGLQGWLVNENRNSTGLKVNVFVNGIYQGYSKCGFFRPDLKEKNISTDGMSGFRYTHPAPLKPGDVVEVKVHANRYQFPQRACTVIE